MAHLFNPIPFCFIVVPSLRGGSFEPEISHEGPFEPDPVSTGVGIGLCARTPTLCTPGLYLTRDPLMFRKLLLFLSLVFPGTVFATEAVVANVGDSPFDPGLVLRFFDSRGVDGETSRLSIFKEELDDLR